MPEILSTLGIPAMRLRAGLSLVLYNAMFTLPLEVVFVLVYLGTTSRQLTPLVRRHAGKVRLATAGLILCLAVCVVVSLL